MTDRFLIGRIDITDNLQFVYETIQSGNPNVIVINLDEDNQQLMHSQNVLGGTELLPTVDCLRAEVDGDEQLYDYLYSMHFGDPFVVQYVTALIAALHQGKSILMYYPTLDPSEIKTVPKLIDQFWKNFGIGIGLLGINDGIYDISKTPLWLRLMYMARIIGYKEFLIEYPQNNPLDESIMSLLLEDIRPFTTTYQLQEQINFILSYWKHLQMNPNTKIPFHL